MSDMNTLVLGGGGGGGGGTACDSWVTDES